MTPPPTAAAAYEIPFPVTDAVTAAQLAAQIESDTAVTYRAFVEQVDTDQLRTFGIDGLTDAAIRGADGGPRWEPLRPPQRSRGGTRLRNCCAPLLTPPGG